MKNSLVKTQVTEQLVLDAIAPFKNGKFFDLETIMFLSEKFPNVIFISWKENGKFRTINAYENTFNPAEWRFAHNQIVVLNKKLF